MKRKTDRQSRNGPGEQSLLLWQMPIVLIRQFKAKCRSKNRSMRTVIKLLIENYLDE